MTLKKTMVATAMTLVAALTLVGCSGSDDPGTDGATSQSGQPGSLTQENFTSSLTQATDAAKSVHIEGSFTGRGQTLTAVVDMSLADKSLTGLAADVSVRLPSSGTYEGRLIDGALYVDATKIDHGQSVTKPWVKVRLTGSASPLAPLWTKMSYNLGPAQLEQTLGAMTGLKTIGPETVDGLSATHYQATIDTTKLPDLGFDPKSVDLTALPKTIVYDVWVDAQNRPVKATAKSAAFSIEQHYSKWGEPVHVVAPPADQVQDAADLGNS